MTNANNSWMSRLFGVLYCMNLGWPLVSRTHLGARVLAPNAIRSTTLRHHAHVDIARASIMDTVRCVRAVHPWRPGKDRCGLGERRTTQRKCGGQSPPRLAPVDQRANQGCQPVQSELLLSCTHCTPLRGCEHVRPCLAVPPGLAARARRSRHAPSQHHQMSAPTAQHPPRPDAGQCAGTTSTKGS